MNSNLKNKVIDISKAMSDAIDAKKQVTTISPVLISLPAYIAWQLVTLQTNVLKEQSAINATNGVTW